MSFDTTAFAVFFIFFICGYYLLSVSKRPYFLLAGSYFFYSSINLAFLPLIILSTSIDYFCGRKIESSPTDKKSFLLLSLALNFGVLLVFKYYVFTAENINFLFDIFNIGYSLPIVELMFPVGISFYTIQTISYTVDVYRGHTKAEKNYLKFSLYVCFFPQLIAGPLERARSLIPQFSKPNKLNYFLTQKYVLLIMIGLAKKTIVSDRLALLIDHNVLNPTRLEYASKNFLTYFMVLFRLYYDFSAYSMMGIGLAGLLGIKLSTNFNYPLFSTNPGEFWRRWHITFFKWLRDYIYRPLKQRNYNPIICVFSVFIFSALWHGAAWTFILWGVINAFYFLIYTGVIRPLIAKRQWAHTKVVAVFACIFNNFVIAFTTPVFHIDNVKDCTTFIINGLKFQHFNLSGYLASISPNLRSDLTVFLIAFFVFESLSFYFFSQDKEISDYKEKGYLINLAIIVLFILSFFLSAGFSPRIRYYYF